MARSARIKSDEHAIEIIANLDGGKASADDSAPIDREALARMRAAIDDAFDRAWARIRAQSAAEVARAPATTSRLIARTKAQLLARIETLRIQLGGQLQLAHRQLAAMSEEDLRSLVADLEDAAGRLTGSS